ncbi:tripartite tricarboxylate transporter TctB family protein [Alcaligenaceae bacterium 429]|nr:tripartite tricarboxylate transporter TctB family protein [Alcaligenaceae bacterium 429]
MRDIVIGVVFAVLGVLIIWHAREFPTVGSLSYGASLFPSVTGAGMGLAGLALVFGNIKSVLAQRQHREPVATAVLMTRAVRVVCPCLLVVLYIYTSDSIGAMPMLAVVMFVLLCLGKVSLKLSIPTSLLGAGLIYYIFTEYLLVPLPEGLLG